MPPQRGEEEAARPGRGGEPRVGEGEWDGEGERGGHGQDRSLGLLGRARVVTPWPDAGKAGLGVGKVFGLEEWICLRGRVVMLEN